MDQIITVDSVSARDPACLVRLDHGENGDQRWPASRSTAPLQTLRGVVASINAKAPQLVDESDRLNFSKFAKFTSLPMAGDQVEVTLKGGFVAALSARPATC